MTHDELKKKIEISLPGILVRIVSDSVLIEKAEDLPKVAKLIREDPDLRMDYLSSITGVDYLTYLESVYHFFSMEKKKGAMTLRVRTNRERPEIPSLVSLYRGAEYQEREIYDLFGIVYTGHPDLRRILMWDNFVGFPMRKDFREEDSETLEAEDVKWLLDHGVSVPDAMKKKAEELKVAGKRALAEKEGKEKF